MITREQIEEIQSGSREKGISIKKLLEEKGIPSHQYFWWKRKYNRQEVAEGSLPVVGGMPPAVMVAATGAGPSRGKSKVDSTGENWMNIELRTVNGTDMRIQGGLTPAMVYTKARGVDERAWLEDVLRRIPEYELGKKVFADLLPGNWKPVTK